jgi:uncharacterized Zn-binding protein involved in type VI secretion
MRDPDFAHDESSPAPVISGAPAARVGDLLSCPGGPPVPLIGPGITTVLIGGKPAAVAGTACNCVSTASPAPVPMPGTLVTGSATVLVGGKSAARIGDQASNGARILAGCTTVLIG